MKHLILFFNLLIVPVPAFAQWKDANLGVQVLAFGVHDTNFFVSDALGTGLHLVYHCQLAMPNLWFGADSGMDPTRGNVTSFASVGAYLFAGSGPTSTGNGYLSTNNGSSWTDPIGGPVGTNGTYIFAQYATRIARSTDSGKTWEHLSYPAGNNYTGNGACVFDYTNSGIWRSLDSGFTWAQIPTPFTGPITVMGSLFFMVGNSKLAESTNSGTNWVTIAVDSAGVSETVNCLATDGKNLFAGTPTGVLVSTDTGKDWRAANDSITYQDIFHDNLTVAEDVTQIGVFDTFVFANVYYNRFPSSSSYYLFECPISELTKPDSMLSVMQTIAQGDTLSVYPNPLTNAATIIYTLANDARVNITIYDALGRNVLIPVASYEATSGEHEITLDAQALPSGIYWCHLTVDNVERVAKMVITR